MRVDDLIKFRKQVQAAQGYATSSRWYVGLSNTFSFLRRAEGLKDPLDRFRDVISAMWNLAMMFQKPGEEENIAFARFVTALKDVPDIRRIMDGKSVEVNIVKFLIGIRGAQTKLLKKQGSIALDTWQKGAVSPDKACRYFFDIVHDVRNCVAHPDFNIAANPTGVGLAAVADAIFPVVMEAARFVIELPVQGTTGKITAYRAFLWPFLNNSDSFFSDYYLERLFPDEELVIFPEDESREKLKALAKVFDGIPARLQQADEAATWDQWLTQYLFPALNLFPAPGLRLIGDEFVFEPRGVVPGDGFRGKLPKEYHGKEAGKDLACLIYALPWNKRLDAVADIDLYKGLTATEVVKRSLAASDVKWGFLTNGRRLRLIHVGTTHKPLSYMDIDLEAIIDRRGDEDARLAFRFLLGLFSCPSFCVADVNGHTLLDRVLRESERHGKEIGDELKENVYTALEFLGDGFLHHLRQHTDELDRSKDKLAPKLSRAAFLESDELLTETYHESLVFMYRLLFLFFAESRNLLPMENELYRESYSLESLRDDIISTLDDPDPTRMFGKGTSVLWDRLKELFDFVNGGWRKLIPVYNGGLFDPSQHEFLEHFKVPDYYLARAIDLLSRTRPRSGQTRGEGRKKVTYRDLDVRHLGSIYEGILEYAAKIAAESMVILREGSGSKSYEEFATISELSGEQTRQFKAWQEAIEVDQDNPILPQGCKVHGYKPKGSYFLVHGGRESKRKSSGSYYTPDYIVQYIVENTLGPLVRGECRPKREANGSENSRKLPIEAETKTTGPLTADEILEIKILDPAMGSGHFLVAATEYLARAYCEALVREGKDEDGVISEDEFIRYKRIIAERCIYGVDLNPMAAELAKLSMWLFTMDRGRPLSFLDLHFKQGNSIIGSRISDLSELPTRGRKRHSIAQPGSPNLFESILKRKLPLMLTDFFRIMKIETNTFADVKAKKNLEQNVELIMRPYRNLADIWLGSHFGFDVPDYHALLVEPEKAFDRTSKISHLQPFHWELEFPEVFFDTLGRRKDMPGFDCIIGNPPWMSIKGKHGTHFYDEAVLAYWENQLEVNSYMPNTFEAFCLQVCQLVSRAGNISMIVPDRLTVNEHYRCARKALLEHGLRRVNFKVPFPGVIVDTVIFLCIGANKVPHLECARYEGPITRIALEDILNSADNIIPFIENSQVAQIWTQYEKATSVKIADCFKTTSGFGGRSQLISHDRQDKRQIMVRKGSDIERFRLHPPRFFDFCRENITGRTTNESILSARPKVLLRKTGDTLIAAYDDSGCYPEQSLYFLYGNHNIDACWCAVGLLNSNLYTFMYRTRFVTNLDTTPQLKKKDLDSFALPEPFPDAECAKLAQQLAKTPSNESLRLRLEKRVYEMFHISGEHQEYIEEFLRRGGSNATD
jgi:hypothetical protein